jgi:hypothetical protein
MITVTRRYHFESAPKALRLAYYGQKTHAKNRGIPFRLSFPQWLKIWQRSGHLHERGCRQGEYVMARFGDQGGYEIGNVKIILHTENSREWVRTKEYREKIRVTSTGRTHSKEARAAISRSCKGLVRANNKKLNEEKVIQIRSEYVPKSVHASTVALAAKYGVRQATIWNIVNRRTWI